MRRRRPQNSGFSLIEAIISLVFTLLFVGGGYLYLGRKIVDDTDPIRAAKNSGFKDPVIVARRDFSSPFGVCDFDQVAFRLKAEKKVFAVCCPAWYGACTIKE